jgi:hypothetical protein
MESVTRFVERRLKLRVNADKSALAPALERPLLGLQFLRAGDGAVRVTVAPKADGRAKDRLRRLTTRNWGVSRERRIREINRFTVGWTAYFCFADTLSLFEGLDKSRQVRWKEWKRPQTRCSSSAWSKRRQCRAAGRPRCRWGTRPAGGARFARASSRAPPRGEACAGRGMLGRRAPTSGSQR